MLAVRYHVNRLSEVDTGTKAVGVVDTDGYIHTYCGQSDSVEQLILERYLRCISNEVTY